MNKIKYIVSVILSVILFDALFSQSCITLNQPLTGNAIVSFSNCLQLEAGFSTNGFSFETIYTENYKEPYVAPSLSNYNYILESIYTYPTTERNAEFIGDKIHKVSYLDGLGRLIQSNSVQAGPEGEDIITFVELDESGLVAKDYLPYSMKTINEGVTISGRFHVNAQEEQISFYGSDDLYPEDKNYCFSLSSYENSPLHRVQGKLGPGANWRDIYATYYMNNYSYSGNSVGEVRKMTPILDINGFVSSIKFGTETGHTFYAESELSKNTINDENGNVSHSFSDYKGSVIMKSTVTSSTTKLATYYLYDQFDQLRVVVPPLAVEFIEDQASLEESLSIASSPVQELCYIYNYDSKHRMISKKLPGAETIYMVYDKRDRLVAKQDGNLRNPDRNINTSDSQWLITRYDIFNRVVMVAIISDTLNHASMITFANSFSGANLYEQEGTSLLGYTNQSFPGNTLTSADVIRVSYYDDYVFAGNNFGESYYNANLKDVTYFPNNQPYFNSKGLLTATKTKIGNSSDWITKVNYFDSKGNLLTSVDINDYFDGIDKVDTEYDFVGKPLKSRHCQVVNLGAGDINTTEWILNDYDHAGRLLSTKHKVGTIPDLPVTVSKNEYDKLGRLAVKNLHETPSGFLQEINFKYNVRNWLTRINDPANLGNDIFSMQLVYESPEEGVLSSLDNVYPNYKNQYNGNIAAIAYVNSINYGGYYYEYDKANRISLAMGLARGVSNTWYNTSKYSSNYTYDANGNIRSLERKKSDGSDLDILDYSYKNNNYSNKLLKINDTGDKLLGFIDGYDNYEEYKYDGNGNMYRDYNKSISNVDYNFLNLPVSVTRNSTTSTYLYDASGVKYEHFNGSGKTTKYFSNFVYENGSLIYILGSEGRILIDGSNPSYEYHLKDHLGNIRIAFRDSDNNSSISVSEISQIADYYPFGLRHEPKVRDDADQNYLYNGKELQEETDWYDYDARYYDPAIGRFTTIDPMAETFNNQSPYLYAYNNPVRYIDYMGMNAEDRARRREERQQRREERRAEREQENNPDPQAQNNDVNVLQQKTDENGNPVLDGGEVPEVEVKPQRSAAGAFMMGTLATAGVTSQLDSPVPGPADVVAAGILVGGSIIAGGIWIYHQFAKSKPGKSGEVEGSEHTSGARKSTKTKHQQGQTRKQQVNRDKKRQKSGWKQNPNK